MPANCNYYEFVHLPLLFQGIQSSRGWLEPQPHIGAHHAYSKYYRCDINKINV